MCWIVIGLLFFGITTAWGQEETSDYLLEGIESVRVEVVISESVQMYMSEPRGQTIIELELRERSINLPKKPEKVDGVLKFEVLAIPIYIFEDDKKPSMFALAIYGSFTQWVRSRLNDEYGGIATTWDNLYVGKYGSEKIREGLQADALRVAQAFANDYLASNPQ